VDESAIGFVLALGRALHRYGTPAHRLEDGLRTCCRLLGLEAEVFTTPTAIILSFGRPTELRTRMLRVEGGELDMGKLALVDEVADEVAARRISPDDGARRLDAIIHGPPQFGRAFATLMQGVTSAALAVFFGGSLQDIALAGAIGLLLGVLAQFLARSTDQARVLELVAAAFAAFVASVVSSAWHDVNPSLVEVSSLVILLPGLSLTVAMTELATRNLIAGTARLMSAVIVLLELVIGVAIGERLASALVHVHQAAPAALPAWASWAALVASALGVAVVLQARPRAFVWIVLASAVGYVGTLAGTAWLGGVAGTGGATSQTALIGVMVGALALGVMSNLYARWLRRPAQIVQVPAVLLLVPGTTGFQGMASLLDKDTMTGVETLFAMFVVAIAIVAGLLVANAIVSPRRSL
jgi:uncharacterized membrane protein YjjP (DUF1212 family)